MWGNKKEDAQMVVKIIDLKNIIRTYVIITLEELTNKNNDDYISSVCLNKISKRFKSLKDYYHYYTNENQLYLLIILAGICVAISGLLNLYMILKCICKTKKKKATKLNKQKEE